MSECKKIPGNKLARNNTYIMRTWNGLTDSSDPTEEVVVFLGYYNRDVSTTIPYMKELDPKRHTCQVKSQNTGE